MKRLVLLLLTLAALATCGFLLLGPDAQANPDATITVNSANDFDRRDAVLSLREAMLLATGGLAIGTLDSGECAQVSNSTYGPSCSTTDTIGAASADTVVFSSTVFPPDAPASIYLASTLPALSTGNDTVTGAGAGVVVDGVSKSFDCLEITADGNGVKKLEVYWCRYGVYIHSGADNNTIGGTSSGERNVISVNNSGVHIEGTGTNSNRITGNYIGTNATGDQASANEYGVEIGGGAQNNTVGGSTEGERNVISGNSVQGVHIEGSGSDGNTVKGNYIGLDASGTSTPIPNGVGVFIEAGAQNNIIGGTTSGERNVISGEVVIFGSGTAANVVKGNYIGLGPDGDTAIGSGLRVYVSGGAQNNIIGGTTSGERNVICGSFGVVIDGSGATGNVIKGNYIGTNAAGTAARGSSGTGVDIASGAQSNIIGGTTEGERNVISGFSNGVLITGSGTTGNVVKGNYIGTNAAGSAAIPNGSGVKFYPGAQSNTVGGTASGEGNVIAYSTADGVWVNGFATTGNTVRSNSIHSNGGKGIENIAGGNTELVPPIIDSASSSVSGHTYPKCYPCTVEVFSDDEDEGRVYHGSTTTNDDATGTWTYAGAVSGPHITATITDASGNTSEFSAPMGYSPPAVGGIAELPDIAGSRDSPLRNYVALAGGLAAALLALTAGAWYARRRCRS